MPPSISALRSHRSERCGARPRLGHYGVNFRSHSGFFEIICTTVGGSLGVSLGGLLLGSPRFTLRATSWSLRATCKPPRESYKATLGSLSCHCWAIVELPSGHFPATSGTLWGWGFGHSFGHYGPTDRTTDPPASTDWPTDRTLPDCGRLIGRLADQPTD